MKKRISLLLTILMFFSISASALADETTGKQYPQKFYDVPRNHWAFEYIAELADRGVIEGYDDGSFKPNRTVTRAEWAKIMVIAAGISTTDHNVYFNDMQNHWAIPYVNAAKNYLTAYADNTYRPNQAAAREDVTMAMVKMKGYDVNEADFSYLSQFTDMNTISNDLKRYVAVAVEKGLIDGFDDNTFRGQNTLTRAEAAKLLSVAFKYGSDNKVVNVPQNQETTVNPIEAPRENEPVVNPTNVPEAPKTTESFTKAPIKEQLKPTPEPTPEPTKKPYKIETLVKTGAEKFTYDNNGTIYYTLGDKIYSLTEDGTNEEVFDENSIVLYDEFGEITDKKIKYDSFGSQIEDKINIKGIFCDNDNNLYFYDNREYHSKQFYYPVYKITNLSAEFYSDYKSNRDNRESIIFMTDGHGINNYGSIEGKSDGILPWGHDPAAICAAEYNGNVIVADAKTIYSYDYNNVTEIANSANKVGLSSIGYALEKDNSFFIRSYDGATKIKIAIDDCAVNDKTPLEEKNIYELLFPMPDNKIVFYDKSAKAFRIISEN